jgi:alkyl hydroperoxide reductase subunit AhpF
MSILTVQEQLKVRQTLAGMSSPVRLVFFGQSLNCDTCTPTRRILQQLVAQSEKVSVEERNLVLDKDAASVFGVDRVPAVVIVADERDTGIRFYGAPDGYEFSALMDAVLLASKGESGLSEASRNALQSVTDPVRIQVFVTPT